MSIQDQQTPPTLDPIHLPLTGSRLIEASAGTGKTFTIALLYVRLVLGPRDEADAESFPRALTPPEILVVTFTNAATRELRDRIRARLVEAADAFLSSPEGQTPKSAEETDPLLALRDSYPRERWPACARRLQLAAEWMDEAAVSTIHSWCHRMLREHAFESGSLFSLEMNLDQSELELEVARDYWRSFYYALDADALAVVTRYWETPEALSEDVRRLQGDADLLPDAPSPAGALAAMQAERSRQLAELKAPWPAWLDELAEQLETAATAKAFDQRKLNSRSRASWLDTLHDWARDPELATPELTDTAWKRLTPEGIAEIWKQGEPLDHPALHAMAELPEQLKTLPDAHADLLAHAVHWMRERRERMQ
ncbi:MAG: UvrD-helicase domain-containing protein [Pseudomonadota bacterium]